MNRMTAGFKLAAVRAGQKSLDKSAVEGHLRRQNLSAKAVQTAMPRFSRLCAMPP